MSDFAAELDRGLKFLLNEKRPTKRKRPNEKNESMTQEKALECVKKGIRYASDPVAACRKTVLMIQNALKCKQPPLSEICLICRCLFDRSKVFRAELIAQLHSICHTLDVKQLYNVEIIELFRTWDTQYASSFPQLRAAVSSIPSKWIEILKKREEDAFTHAVNRDAEKRMEDIQLEHTRREIDANESIILSHVDSMERTLAMLIPTVEDCFSALLPSNTSHAVYDESDNENDLEWEDVHVIPPIESWSLNEVISSCGLGSASYSISIPVPELTASNDLELVQNALREQRDELSKTYLPLVKKWQVQAQKYSSHSITVRVEKLISIIHVIMAKVDEMEFNKAKA